MKKHRVKYYFDGIGYIDVWANSKAKAKQKFIDGDYDPEKDENEWGENYEVYNVEVIKD